MGKRKEEILDTKYFCHGFDCSLLSQMGIKRFRKLKLDEKNLYDGFYKNHSRN